MTEDNKRLSVRVLNKTSYLQNRVCKRIVRTHIR